jgi:hypothetical protein
VIAADVEPSDRLVPANELLIDCHEGSAGEVRFGWLANHVATSADDAALMADEAAAASAAPCGPALKARLTIPEADPGAMSTVTAVAVGNCASIAARTAAALAALSGLANVI